MGLQYWGTAKQTGPLAALQNSSLALRTRSTPSSQQRPNQPRGAAHALRSMTAIPQPNSHPTDSSPPFNNPLLPHNHAATPQSRPRDHTNMNPLPPPFAGPARTQNGRGLQTRHSAEFRNPAPQGAPPGVNGNGPMPVPAVPRGPVGNGQQDNLRGFAGARSPPSG
jgi:hypothetical protein